MKRACAVALIAVTLGVAACGSTNTAKTISTAAGARSTQTGDTGNGRAGTATASGATVSAPTETSTSAPTTATSTTPATVTTDTITAPDSGGAPLTGTTQTADRECTASDLSAGAVSPNSAPGMTVLGFTLRNSSGQACESGAYPGIGLLSASGGVDDVTTVRTTSDDLGSTPVTRIDLAPGDEMSFRITLHDSNSSSGSCGSYSGVEIIAPNDTVPIKVTVPDGPVQSCGSVGVSPVEPGTAGTGQ